MGTRRRSDRDAIAAIGKELRGAYGDIIAEGIPEGFAGIMHRLDGQDCLSAEQRRALELLAIAERGLTPGTLRREHGFTPAILASLAGLRLVQVVHRTVMQGGRTEKVARVRITDAGRKAIQEVTPCGLR
jgi:hypothetical protein